MQSESLATRRPAPARNAGAAHLEDVGEAPLVTPLRHVIAMVNGPGEVAAWLYPFAARLRERDQASHLTAALLPCVFAAGSEPSVLARMHGVDAVSTVRDTMAWIVRGRMPSSIRVKAPLGGCVLHLGGDIVLSALLSRRLRYPLVVYSEDPVRHAGLAHRICLADRSALASAEDASRVVGNLMVDAARLRVPDRAIRHGSSPVIALFPGSRAYQVRSMLPFLVKVAGDVSRRHGPVRWIVAKSEFISESDLAAFASGEAGSVIEGEASRLVAADGGFPRGLVSDRGVRLEVRTASEAMRVADMALTIPGTNTAELAALGIPMLLLFPTHDLRDVPLPGVAGHLKHLPVVGGWLTEAIARSYLRSRPYWAHPNCRSRAPIVPEIIGRFTAGDIAGRLCDQLDAGVDSMAARLRESMGPPGGAARLVSEVLDTIARHADGRSVGGMSSA